MLKIKNLDVYYGNLKVIRTISCHIRKGEIVSLIGANGAGKSTTLKTISGLLKPKSGEIIFENINITDTPPEKIVSEGCILVPEGRQLFGSMTVKDNLTLGAYNFLRQKKTYNLQKELDTIFARFPILEERKNQFAGTMSGGEQQMLAIGRALMAKPKLLMLDEPSTGLAPKIVKDILSSLVELKHQGLTILLVEQNANAALAISDRGYVMETGKIVLEGTKDELLNNGEVQRAYLGKDYKSIGER